MQIDNSNQKSSVKTIDAVAQSGPLLSNLGPKLNIIGSDLGQSLTTYITEMNRLMNCINQDSTKESSEFNHSWKNISSNEKQFLIDVFCWNKDEFSADAFYQILPNILDSIKGDKNLTFLFFNSYEFHLFLKSNYEFYNFEQEEQNYPEHDNFFISKDFSFLFEYQLGEKSSDIIEEILDNVLQVVGSEYFISKLQISNADSFQMLQEEAYTAKVSRLASSGYPSYEESLEWQTPLTKLSGDTDSSSLKLSLENKALETTNLTIPTFSLLKTLQAIFEFKKSNNVNEEIASSGLLKKSLEEVLFYIKLGKQVLLQQGQIVFDDYKKIYRAGKTKILEGKKVSNSFRTAMLGNNYPWSFIGDILSNIADDFLAEALKIKENKQYDDKYLLSSIDNIENSIKLMKVFIKNQNIIDKFWLRYKDISDDANFLNYTKDQVNFEGLIITDFISSLLVRNVSTENHSINLSIMNLQAFIQQWNTSTQVTQLEMLHTYIENFELAQEDKQVLITYLQSILNLEILSLNYEKMTNDDYRFVGGVILAQD